MKFVAITLLAFVVATIAAPTSISDNNIGNIVTVGINANVELSNKIDQTLINLIYARLNQQGIRVSPGQESAEVSKLPENINITPKMINQFKNLLTKH